MTEQTDSTEITAELGGSDAEARRSATRNFLNTAHFLMCEYGPENADGVFDQREPSTPVIEVEEKRGRTRIRVSAEYGRLASEAQGPVILSATVHYPHTKGSRKEEASYTVSAKRLLPLDYLDIATIALGEALNAFEDSGLVPNSKKPELVHKR